MTEFERLYINEMHSVADALYEISKSLDYIGREALTSGEMGDALRGLSAINEVATAIQDAADNEHDVCVTINSKGEKYGEGDN